MDMTKTKHLLIIQEGYRSFVYDDVTGLNAHGNKGRLTIGHGRNLEQQGIDATEADMLLTNDIQHWIKGYNSNLPWFKDLDDVRQAVLISLAHNVGMKGALEFTHMLGYMHQKAYHQAALALLDSEVAKSQATARRYHDLAKMLDSGEWLLV